ncbi:hypothetical protein ABZ532_27875 [Streptomyces sp. NPDC019396]|uniref:hypothetical protein n=1 Tax=Streptomyces sp. NPDC019396 TaxID=3154687 RepID=UPI003407F4EE
MNSPAEGATPVVNGRQDLRAEQRRALFRDGVRRRGGARGSVLTRSGDVSPVTVSRGPDALARRGAVTKVDGGAMHGEAGHGGARAHEPGCGAKSAPEPGATEDIARTALGMVAPGSALALPGGTATEGLPDGARASLTERLPRPVVADGAPGRETATGD